MKDRLSKVLGRQPSYTNLEDPHIERNHVAWWWKVLAVLSSWLIVGGYLMLPSTFDTDDGYKINKKALAAIGITLVVLGLCCTAVLHFAVREAKFRVDSIYFPAFTSCLVGLLTVFYSFLVQHRYEWNLAAKLTAVFTALMTIGYGVLIITTQRRLAYVKPLPKPRHIPLTTTSYEESRTIYEPSLQSRPSVPNLGEDSVPREQTYYSNYLTNMYPMLRSNSRGTRSSAAPHDADSIFSERPPVPPINNTGTIDPSTLTEEELQRQQMLMLLLHRSDHASPPAGPADGTISPQSRAETSYHIDWQGSNDPLSPITGPGAALPQQFQSMMSPTTNPVPPYHNPSSRTPVSPIPQPQMAVASGPISPPPAVRSPPGQQPNRSQSTAKVGRPGGEERAPGVPPPSYNDPSWDGVWRTPEGVAQEVLHPAFRQPRPNRNAGGDRETRRREIERGSI